MTARSILFFEGKKATVSLKRLVHKATGKTQRQIKPLVRKEGKGFKLEILTPANFIYSIRGRGPGKLPPSMEEWLALKGLSDAGFAIRKTIAAQGTKLWSGKGKSNLKKSEQIIDKMATDITSKLADLQVKETLKKIDGN